MGAERGSPSDRTGKDIKARVEEGQGVPFFDERFSCREARTIKGSKGHLLKSVDPPLTPLFQDGGAWTAFRELVPCTDIVSSTISNLYTHIFFFLAGVGLD